MQVMVRKDKITGKWKFEVDGVCTEYGYDSWEEIDRAYEEWIKMSKQLLR